MYIKVGQNRTLQHTILRSADCLVHLKCFLRTMLCKLCLGSVSYWKIHSTFHLQCLPRPRHPHRRLHCKECADERSPHSVFPWSRRDGHRKKRSWTSFPLYVFISSSLNFQSVILSTFLNRHLVLSLAPLPDFYLLTLALCMPETSL